MAAAPPRRNRPSQTVFPLRILTAVPICDGHDSAIMTINHELVGHGAEVIYLGYHQPASAVARAAIQEDVHAIGLSSYNGGHLVFFREVVRQLRARGGADIRVFGGGGGTITPQDERKMRRAGVERVFFAGTPMEAIIATLARCARPPRKTSPLRGDRMLARQISLAEAPRSRQSPALARDSGCRSPFVVGVVGPGGAGKSTLIDELATRFLRLHPRRRLAILANDPSQPDSGGALLGDRASAIYSRDDRVYFRSLATRASLTGISAGIGRALGAVAQVGDFDLVFVESVGVGQESDPFGRLRGGSRLADAVLFVLPPQYGGPLQLEKIALLRGADLIALNKCDDPRAATARIELGQRLERDRRQPPVFFTIAAQHNDAGIDRLFRAIAELAELEPAGGERACQLQISG